MSDSKPESTAERFRAEIAAEYRDRFPESARRVRHRETVLYDGTSHAVRWNDPFMPTVARADGAYVEDIDGNRIVDYWQGHFSNLLGHNPAVIREALIEALDDGRGLQTGMLHEVEAEVAELVCRTTGCETVRFTTAGTLGTFYATVLARAFTGRDKVLKISGGWHGSQPFGLKGVTPHGAVIEQMESEGLSTSVPGEVMLTRFNDVEALRETFRARGDTIACLVLEPIMGAAGGFVATREFMTEARRLTESHGALLLCDEIITGYRHRAGDLTREYGIEADLLILGKVLGGGLPVAAVAGRADILRLSSREVGRVKFEGGTYSGHELAMIAARTMLRHLVETADVFYPALARTSRQYRARLRDVYQDAGIAVHVTGSFPDVVPDSSLILFHPAKDGSVAPTCPEELAASRHPAIDERLLKSVLMLHGISTRNGLGIVTASHQTADLDFTVQRYRAALDRIKRAELA